MQTRIRNWRSAAGTGALTLAAACGLADAPVTPPSASAEARFAYLTYSGSDPIFELPLSEGQARNPILAGYYPDPSIVKVGEDYYLVNSSFTHYPGIPVFHSRDLINWTQIGNVIDRPDMLDFSGLTVSRGVFAPTIEFHDGLFHVINTCVDCGGNFIVTATDPAGPWSDPVWLPHVGGIDPSLFFDEGGKAYILNNDAPEGEPLYQGHRAVWIREVDPESFAQVSEPVVAVNGGVDLSKKPVWIEGPHLYKVDGKYLLSAAEGGTGPQHSQVILTAESPLGPFTPHPDNPVLTQRDLPEDRPEPITSVGHADFTQDGDGNWWAVFLGTRPYQGNEYNTGRETFLMPVTWENGIPRITAPGDVIPHVIDRPALPAQPDAPLPLTGNFTYTDAFDEEALPLHWLTVRIPSEDGYRLETGDLVLEKRAQGVGDPGHPSFLGRRQQHTNAEAYTEVMFVPGDSDDEAGLAAFQNDAAYYTLGLSLNEDGASVVRLRRRASEDADPDGEIVTEVPALAASGEPLKLKIAAHGPEMDFYQASPEGEWQPVALGEDGTILSTEKAGGFVGTLLGVYAQSEQD
ncbi:glycoside hydrolase family 43 protein [Hyphomonas sp.]|jgi:alpha-N-arabinofuranosidase|uniref:glycoside hydrolase family 43 protein n=1 Tax=Hyphomonas sp. TaxID=87 RepID=UPI003001A78A